MKFFALFAVALAGAFVTVESITCYSCSATLFHGATEDNNVRDDCYDNLAGSPTTVTTTADDTTAGQYCYTLVTLTNGLVTEIERGSINGNSDSDLSTTGVPPNPTCRTTYSVGVGEVTTCSHACTTSDCNIQAITNFKTCSTNCSETENVGYCDYFTGACACAATRSGSNCNTKVTKTYRKCVQCNSETDSGCETSTTSTQCPNAETIDLVYCATSKTTVFSASGAVVRSVVTKGCALKSASQSTQCALTAMADPQFTGYNEYTCTDVCDTDGCNTAAPTGSSSLQCVQCTGTDDSTGCATMTARVACPTGSNQCYMKAVYLIANKTHSSVTVDPDYRFISVERGCRTSTTSVNQCTTTTLGTTNVQNVTCEESCTDAGCNTGWPNRTSCSQCMSGDTTNEGVPLKADGYDPCVFNPPPATACARPYESMCYFSDKGESLKDLTGFSGYTRWMRRGCTYHDVGNGCNTTTVDNVEYSQCNKTCSTDGCNQGNGAVLHLQSFVMLSLPAVLGYFMQRFFSN